MTPGFSAAAWDAVKSEVIPYLHDPRLQGLLATYFSEVDVVLAVNQRYVDSVVGVMSALNFADNLRRELQDHLAARAKATAELGEKLRPMLRDVLERTSGH